MDYILGIDSGGTKTFVQIADFKGKVLAESEKGSGNYKSIGIDEAIKNIGNAILTTIKKVELADTIKFSSACFGLSGADTPQDEEIYRKHINKSFFSSYLPQSRNLIICNDSKIGLYAATDNKNAIMIICGTGSNCYGINEKGEEAKANGWDYLIGDEGSGFSIGLKALRAIMRSYDGRSKKTILTNKILDKLGLDGINSLIKWVYKKPFTIDSIAALAEIVCKTAGMGDRVSVDILLEEADEAFISISTVAKKLGLGDKKFDLVFVGSLFKCEEYFKKVLEKKIIKWFPKVTFIPFTKKPVSGAIKLAKEKAYKIKYR